MSPGSSLTGFPPGKVNGTIHATDPTAARAQADLTIAYNDAAGRQPPQALPLDIGGETLAPGVYKTGATPALGVTGTLTLDGRGDPNAVFVFQVGSALTTAVSSRVNLINGANAANVFWQVGSSATLGTSSTFAGSILALTSISVDSGVTLDGRALARNGAVTLIDDTINVPSASPPPPPPPPTHTTQPCAPLTVPFYSRSYGDCRIDPGSDVGGCGSPLEVQSWPECARNLSSYTQTLTNGKRVAYPHRLLRLAGLVSKFLPNGLPSLVSHQGQLLPALAGLRSNLSQALQDALRVTKVSQIPAASFDVGARIELYTGDTTVVIFADDPVVAEKAAATLALKASAADKFSPARTRSKATSTSGCSR